MSTLPPGATSSAASRPVSPRPAASSRTRWPGCGRDRLDHPARHGHRGALEGRRAAPSSPARRPPSARGSPPGSLGSISQLASQQLAGRACAAATSANAIAFGHLEAGQARRAPASQVVGARRGSVAGRRSPPRPRPTRGPARPWTAASATAGWASSTASTSAGATFSPPVMIVSALRPMTRSAPSASSAPRSPVRRTGPDRGATVGPETRISPSAARRTRVQNSGAPSGRSTCEQASVSP